MNNEAQTILLSKDTSRAEDFAVPEVFFVTRQQQEIIEEAIEKAAFSGQRIAEITKTTKAQRRAEAITEISRQYLREVKNVKSKIS